jgi:hypothetical protein
MLKHQLLTGATLIVLTVGLAACGQTQNPPATPAPSSGVGGVPSASPDASPSPTTDPSTEPTPSADPSSAPTPTLRPRPVHWSTGPTRIFSVTCGSPVATVDDTGRFHVAAECDQRIRYATSADGKTWGGGSTLPTPANRFDVAPQLAVDGRTLYVAYTRLKPVDGGCGDDGLDDIGVYYRSRALPDGSWSAETRIGHVGDVLQSFRVVDGVIHETFSGSGGVSYASLNGGTWHEVSIPNAQESSLRVGDDGRARIAFSTTHAIRYGVVSADGRLSVSTVFAAKDVFMGSPVLVLGRGNHAFVSFTALPMQTGGGCAEPEPPNPANRGTWFATDADGSWATKHISKEISAMSLALDVDSGRLHAIYTDPRGVRYVTRAPDGTWSGSRLDPSIRLYGDVLRRDPVTGRLLLVGTSESETKEGIYALTAS